MDNLPLDVMHRFSCNCNRSSQAWRVATSSLRIVALYKHVQFYHGSASCKAVNMQASFTFTIILEFSTACQLGYLIY